jgi:hypothetical protein
MMTLAATLAALVGWLEDGGRGGWAALAAGGAAIVVIHPVAGLLGYALLGGTILLWGATTRAIERPLGAALALVAGFGLAAFYWLPLWIEWSYVSGSRATMGGFRVTKHFVPPLAFLGIGESSLHVPVAPGTTAIAVAILATLAVAWRWRRLTPSGRRLAILLWLLVISSTVLMTDVSRVVWTSLPLVALIQFPWRLLMVQTIALAALAGCLPGAPRVMLVFAAVAVAWPLVGLSPLWVQKFDHVETAAELEQLMIAPDAVAEWLPSTAQLVRPPRQWRSPRSREAPSSSSNAGPATCACA